MERASMTPVGVTPRPLIRRLQHGEPMITLGRMENEYPPSTPAMRTQENRAVV
jgi:hypothetical protein